MGLFKRRHEEPLLHPPIDRRILVAAPLAALEAQLRSYDELSPRAPQIPIELVEAPGWSAVVIGEPIHPWAFHNLAMWLMDTEGSPDVVAVAEAGEGCVGYWLADDPCDSWMSGYDDRGGSITVCVPSNEWVRGDQIAHPPATVAQALARFGVPTEWSSAPAVRSSWVRLEDPGRHLNPSLRDSFPSRRKMQASGDNFVVS